MSLDTYEMHEPLKRKRLARRMGITSRFTGQAIHSVPQGRE